MKGSIHTLFLIPALLFLNSCGPSEEKLPKDVLPEDRFQKVLLELYMVQGEAAHRKAQYATDPKEFLPHGTKKVLEEHDLNREKFVRSYRYYLKEPKRMKRIHEEVLNELMRRTGKEKEE